MSQVNNTEFLKTVRENAVNGTSVAHADCERIGEIIKNAGDATTVLDSVEALTLISATALKKDELTDDDKANLGTTVRRFSKIAVYGPNKNVKPEQFKDKTVKARTDEIINNGFDIVADIATKYPEVIMMDNYLFGLTKRAISKPFAGFELDGEKVERVKQSLENVFAV